MTLHRNAARVQAALHALGIDTAVRTLPDSAHTAAEAAAALEVEPGAIAKSLVFVAAGDPVVAVLAGPDRLDPARLAAHLGVAAAEVARADADTVRTATGFPIGGVPPLGHASPLRVLVDGGLAAQPVVWAAAGTPHDVFPTTYAQLLGFPTAEAAEVAVR